MRSKVRVARALQQAQAVLHGRFRDTQESAHRLVQEIVLSTVLSIMTA